MPNLSLAFRTKSACRLTRLEIVLDEQENETSRCITRSPLYFHETDFDAGAIQIEHRSTR